MNSPHWIELPPLPYALCYLNGVYGPSGPVAACVEDPPPLTRDEWLQVARRLISDLQTNSSSSNQLIDIPVTRGVVPHDHTMPAGLKPTVFVMCSEMKEASRGLPGPVCALPYAGYQRAKAAQSI